MAQEILLKHTNSDNFQKGMILAIQFNFIDEFIQKLIEKANRNTNEVNVLMQYIDYFHNPDQIVQQYGQDVTIGQIRDKLTIAFSKLDLYQKLVKAAKKIGDFQYHDQFTKTVEKNGEGYDANQDELLCNLCNKKLIDRDVLIRLRQHIGK